MQRVGDEQPRSQASTSPPWYPRAAEAAGLGLASGAFAGAWVALGDFGATWLWLPLWRDRAGLLLRLLASLLPAGALVGALLGLLSAFAFTRAARFGPRARRLWPLPFVLLALPVLRVVALKLCSGGMMSRLPQRAAVEWAFTLALPAGLYVLLRATGWLARAVTEQRVPARAASLGLLGLSFGVGKLNQLLLPNLYDYLHGGLALASWAAAALGAALALLHGRALDRVRERALRPRVGLFGALLAALVLLANLVTLNLNLNVRVAMFDARSPSSRALLAGLDPVLRSVEGRSRGNQRGHFAREAVDTTGLPTVGGAHVLLITVDALRADHLGSYGYARETSPNLDQLARGAVVFERAYAQAPHSSYSLSSLHTSEYIHEVVELGRPLPEQTLATALASHGYHTAAFFTDGVFHTEGARLAHYRDSAFGFALFDHTNRESEDQTDRVLQEIDRIKGLGEPPSFLWVHYFDVHEPYQETHFGSGELDRYDSEIRHVDRELARLIREVEARCERDVVIAISADHGEEFREHGGVYHGSTLYDEQVRVPLILRSAALPAARIAAPVEVIDVGPTLFGLVGIEPPPGMRGRDLRALALKRVAEHGPVFSAVLTKRMALHWPYKIIADLRFGLFELYDLVADPNERRNLAASDPTRLASLRELVYGWLDSLEAPSGNAGSAVGAEDAWLKALRWGRLGDRRAVEPTSRLLLDTSAPTAMRVEAGQILAKLADESSAGALVKGMQTTPPEVAAEAAIALGRMYDPRAREALRGLVHVEDPFLRARAAVSLGRLRDTAAVPALIDALAVAPTLYEREEAVRWLGRLRDKRALEPLLGLIPEFGMRYLVAVALGQLGDPRAFDALADMLRWENRTNIRDEVVRGLGLLGDARAIPLLMDVLVREPGLKNTAESLVRLGALQQGYLGGADLSPAAKGQRGFSECEAGPLFHDWDYLERTRCTTVSTRAQLDLALPSSRAAWSAGAQLVLRLRRADAPEASSLNLVLGGRAIGSVRVDGNWTEQRIELTPAVLAEPGLRLGFDATDPNVRVTVDHALLVPRSEGLMAEPSELPKPPDDAQKIP